MEHLKLKLLIKEPSRGIFSGTSLENKLASFKSVKLDISPIKYQKLSDGNFIIITKFPYKRGGNMDVIIEIRIIVNKELLEDTTLDLGEKVIDITETSAFRKIHKDVEVGYAFEIDAVQGSCDKILFE